ncbi:GNAT family N-acetyltransferase [Alsobacter soli]|uniref:GNAT family N-acetyltransferase n=1 Tax=Alsobacter soli TaxID=2109933 RepID=A0A2T1HWC7_9HYPH|nr:GNAT family N-acetyltransferase [Alsobacter soli]PSC05924.1 GNAT family N-acetyltransferase [Alsobacter soli]
MNPEDLAQPAEAPADLVSAFERHSARAWPAPDVIDLHGWELRLTPGSRSRRVNSLNAIRPEPGRFDAVLDAARRICAERGAPCVVRLTPLTPPEALRRLAGEGREAAGETLVLHAPIADVHPSPGGEVSAQLTPGWLAGMAASGADAAERALIARLLAAVPIQQGFGVALDDGRALAFGRIAVEDGIAGVFHVATAPEARRRGLARRLMAGLLAWARERGAETVYLQVVAENHPAIALYRACGFREAYRYAYLTA